MLELNLWFYMEGVVIGWRVRTNKCLWLWNIWKHLSTSPFPFLPHLLLFPSTEEWWVKGRDELLKFPFGEGKGTVLRKAQRKHLPQLFSLPFLSPFLNSVIIPYYYRVQTHRFFLLPTYVCSYRWSEVSVSDHKCTGSAPRHLKLCLSTIFPKGYKGRLPCWVAV